MNAEFQDLSDIRLEPQDSGPFIQNSEQEDGGSHGSIVLVVRFASHGRM